jgi:hypothetical protein
MPRVMMKRKTARPVLRICRPSRLGSPGTQLPGRSDRIPAIPQRAAPGSRHGCPAGLESLGAVILAAGNAALPPTSAGGSGWSADSSMISPPAHAPRAFVNTWRRPAFPPRTRPIDRSDYFVTPFGRLSCVPVVAATAASALDAENCRCLVIGLIQVEVLLV